MRALEFWQTVTMDRSDLLGRLLAAIREGGVRYCLIGGQAVNAYADPLVSLDLDIVIATDEIARLEGALAGSFRVELFPRSVNLSAPDSDLRVQIQTDPRYADFPSRASERDVLGLTLSVASAEDVLQGKVWAALDPGRRASKRQKDLVDIARLIEARPDLRARVPAEILDRLLE